MFFAVGILVPAALTAQTTSTFYARGGATWSSKLVQDQIVNDDISTTPAVALTLVAGGGVVAFPRYLVDLELQFTTGSYSAETEGQGSTNLGTLRTLSGTLGLNGPLISPNWRWRAGMGLLSYLPSEKEGMFLRGGPLSFLIGAGVDYRRPVSGSLDLMVSLRYDFHRFTTDELQAQGFSQTQQVHRIGLTVGIATGGRP
jgi:hypothetical protein